MTVIISRVIIGASLPISMFLGLFGLVVAQSSFQVITIHNSIGMGNITVTIEPQGTTQIWDPSINRSGNGNKIYDKKAKAYALVNAVKRNNNGKFRSYTLNTNILEGNEQIFPAHIPSTGEKNKLTFKLKNAEKEFCTIECVRMYGNKRPLKCNKVVISHNLGHRCMIDTTDNITTDEITVPKTLQLSTQSKDCMIKIYSINNIVIVAYKMEVSPSPSAPPPYAKFS